MKCIKSIKATKNTEVGVLVRTSDVEAESKVKTGYWAYAPKSEYKTWKRGATTEEPQSTEKKKDNPKQMNGVETAETFVKTRKKSK
jgi:hypothetical protein